MATTVPLCLLFLLFAGTLGLQVNDEREGGMCLSDVCRSLGSPNNMLDLEDDATPKDEPDTDKLDKLIEDIKDTMHKISKVYALEPQSHVVSRRLPDMKTVKDEEDSANNDQALMISLMNMPTASVLDKEKSSDEASEEGLVADPDKLATDEEEDDNEKNNISIGVQEKESENEGKAATKTVLAMMKNLVRDQSSKEEDPIKTISKRSYVGCLPVGDCCLNSYQRNINGNNDKCTIGLVSNPYNKLYMVLQPYINQRFNRLPCLNLK